MPAPCQRCSRPLCSSQTTTPYPPHAPHPPPGGRTPGAPAGAGTPKQRPAPVPQGNRRQVLLPQDPTVCHGPDPNRHGRFPAGKTRRTHPRPGARRRPRIR
jgi:hypothetical protein